MNNLNGDTPPESDDFRTAIPNSNSSVGYRSDFASVFHNRVNELTVGFCRNGSQRTEFSGDAELLQHGYRWTS